VPQGLKAKELARWMSGLKPGPTQQRLFPQPVKPVPFKADFHALGWAARPILTPVEMTKFSLVKRLKSVARTV
jgi:hypothetical protein